MSWYFALGINKQYVRRKDCSNNSLEVLSIQKLDVESFPDEAFLPFSLTSLQISNCSDL